MNNDNDKPFLTSFLMHRNPYPKGNQTSQNMHANSLTAVVINRDDLILDIESLQVQYFSK